MGPIRELQETQALSGVTACTPRWPSLSFTFCLSITFFFFFFIFFHEGQGEFLANCFGVVHSGILEYGEVDRSTIGSIDRKCLFPFWAPDIDVGEPDRATLQSIQPVAVRHSFDPAEADFPIVQASCSLCSESPLSTANATIVKCSPTAFAEEPSLLLRCSLSIPFEA